MNPIITLPELEEGENYCPNDPIEIVGQCIGTFDRVEWSVIGAPAGGELVLSSTTDETITVTPNVNGDYTVKFCCYETNGPQNAAEIQGPFLSCPHSVPIQSNFTVDLLECPEGSVVSWNVTGDQFAFPQGTSAIIRPQDSGDTINVEVTCTDTDGNVSTVTCEILVHDSQLELTDEDGEVSCFTAIDCSETCFCTDIIIPVNCAPPDCLTLCIDINAREVVEPVTEEECVPAVAVPLVGLKSSFTAYPVEYDCLDCEDESCRPVNDDMPNFIWNDCARCPNWTVQGDAANASDCVPGNPWCFDGSGTYTVQSSDGSECSVDVIVIYGHNIESATVSASVPIFGGDRDFSICYDQAKIGGFTRPIVVPLDGLYQGTSFSFTVSGTGVNGQPICIDYAMFGQKLFLPDDALPADFVNPLDGSDREFTVKNSECGALSRISRQRPVTWSISIEAPEPWICETWRSYMRYLGEGNPVLFQPSRNNKEQDILLGYLTGQQEGSSFVDCCYSSVTLSAQGFINQQQPKSFQ